MMRPFQVACTKIWSHLFVRFEDGKGDCPYCKIAQLEAELTKAEEEYDWLMGVNGKWQKENERLKEAEQVAKEQAEDEGLWFLIATASEGYLQQALRRLHAVIEGDALKELKESE